jgi:UDP-N-acetylmuramyl pentapeptide phosphotransferase/UDP-N-acetylglucosamine-1-phosphate transferase
VAVVVAFVAGIVAALVAWRALTPAFAAPVFTRENFRQRTLPTAVGVVVALVAVAGAAVVLLACSLGWDPDPAVLDGITVVVPVAVGFALLGLLDDLGGEGQSGGFKGHLAELAHGRLTTGGAKLFGGAALGVIAAAPFSDGDFWQLVADGALIALAANLANLFDRRPGRVVKVSLLAGVVLVAAVGLEPQLAGVALALGAAAGLLVPDLRERLMLGDSGANVLGAALGLGVLVTCSPGVRVVVLAVVLALNLVSEVVSFSKVIDRVAPLRAFDQLGREPAS